MKKLKKLVACLLMLCMAFSFAACGGNETGNTTVTEEVPHITAKTTETTTEPTTEYKPKPYDSNKLVWLTQYYEFSHENLIHPCTAVIDEDHYAYKECSELSELLKKNGVDKEIEFRRMVLPQDKDRTRALEEVINSGEQIDIIQFDYKPLSCLMDLSDYFSTDKGKAIKAAVSENVWRGLGEPEGKHYFVPTRKVLYGEQNGYTINIELMKKIGLTESDLTKGINGLNEVFEKVKSDDYSCYGTGGAGLGSTIIYPRFAPVDIDVTPFLMIDRESKNGMVQNIYENAECAEQLKVIGKWRQNGIFFETEKSPLLFDGGYYVKNDTDSNLKVLPIGEAYANSTVRGSIFAISKTSQNADAAFDVLALTITNSEISMKLNPNQQNIIAPESELKFYDSFGFYADFAPVQKEYDECRKVVHTRFNMAAYSGSPEFGNPWCGEMADVESGLKELNAELKAAGLDKVLDELNRQLDEFYKKSAEQ